MNRRWAPWFVPATVPVILTGVALFPATATGSTHPSLTTKSAAELVADVLTARPISMSGTVDLTVRLGLPELPTDSRTASSLSWTNFVSGSHTFRVWYGDPNHFRLALLGQLSESDVVRSGADLWTYRSADNSVSHATVPTTPPLGSTPPASPTDPATMAKSLLTALATTSDVRVTATEWVANRPAYTIELLPKQTGSLIRNVSIAIDSATSLPLRLSVYGADSRRPAISFGFTKVDFAAPSPSIFVFKAPAGATTAGAPKGGSQMAPAGVQSGTPSAKVLGTGWTSVVRIDGITINDPLFTRSAKRVPQGRLLTTALLSVLITPSGTVFAGAVTPDLLIAAATR